MSSKLDEIFLSYLLDFTKEKIQIGISEDKKPIYMQKVEMQTAKEQYGTNSISFPNCKEILFLGGSIIFGETDHRILPYNIVWNKDAGMNNTIYFRISTDEERLFVNHTGSVYNNRLLRLYVIYIAKE